MTSGSPLLTRSSKWVILKLTWKRDGMLPAVRSSASRPEPVPANNWNPITLTISSTTWKSCFLLSKRHKPIIMQSPPLSPSSIQPTGPLREDGPGNSGGFLSAGSNLRARLQRSPVWVFVLYVSLASFVVYTCMYGFRKPFTAASFNGLSLFGISYKVVLVIAQVLGYMLSNFYGIRFISGMEPAKRAGFIIKLILTSWVSLLLFGLVPAPYNFVFMFINGLPLGMVWGLVFGFLEGRKVTELMGAVLATSFIFASGLAKTVGKGLILSGVSEGWMPFVAGAVFVVPLLLATWLLNQNPPPTADDVAYRTVRLPMSKQ